MAVPTVSPASWEEVEDVQICDEEECRGKEVYYEGESAHSGYTRGRAHLRGYRNKEKESVLWKHACNDHGGRMACRKGRLLPK